MPLSSTINGMHQIPTSSFHLSFENAEGAVPDDGILIPAIGGDGGKYIQLIDRSRYRMIDMEKEFNEAEDWDLSFPKMKQIETNYGTYGCLLDTMSDDAGPTAAEVAIPDWAEDFSSEKAGTVYLRLPLPSECSYSDAATLPACVAAGRGRAVAGGATASCPAPLIRQWSSAFSA